jgi:hypothetical protein
MWAKDRFSYMAEFATKARGLGLTHIKANASISPQMLSELIEAAVAFSSIHSHCPAVISSREIPIHSLSSNSLDKNKPSLARYYRHFQSASPGKGRYELGNGGQIFTSSNNKNL